jgi:hypothetical protein
MKQTERDKKFKELERQMEIDNFASNKTRARSVTVGTAFGGTTELMMRMPDGTVPWALMQPVEVIELIHQLAANVGCHIHLQPRRDFSSWRDWRVTEEEKLHLSGFPPFPNDMRPHAQVGANLPPPDQQPGMKIDRSNEHVVAIEKTVKRRSTKRTPKTA